MKSLLAFTIISIIGITACNTVSSPEKTATFKVWGNCEKCEKTIESSCAIDGVKEKDWNVESKLMTLKFDTTKVTLDELQQLIAKVGYDNDAYYGDDYAYAKLESCCQYERKPFEAR